MPDTFRISRIVRERFFHRLRVSIHHRQVGARNFRLPIFDCRLTRVADTLPFMHAPHEHRQHLCHRVLSVACSGFLTMAPRCIGVRYAWNASALDTGKSACATRETKYYSHSFSDDCQPWYVVKVSGVVGYERAGVFDGSGSNPGILGGDRLPPPHAANLAPSRAQLPV